MKSSLAENQVSDDELSPDVRILGGLKDSDEVDVAGIYDWAVKRPEWQRDALSRLATQGKLTNADFEELQLQIEYLNGLPVSRIVEPQQLVRETVQRRDKLTTKTVLGSIGPVRNVDRLAEDQKPLRFAKSGITLIYGANGSGKSGYCRLAKKLCRCLHDITLRGNVYDDEVKGPPEVQVEFQVDGQQKETINWNSDEDAPTALARISVFDSYTAGLYVDGERKIEFLPYELDLLNKLANAFQTLEEKFAAREKALITVVKGPLPTGFNTGTPIQAILQQLAFVRKIGDIPSEQELRDLAIWNADHETRLSTLTGALKDDSVTKAKTYRQFRNSLEVLKTECADIALKLSDAAALDLKTKRDDAAAKRDAANSAAAGLFKDEPIKDLGSDSWRQMLKYARDFAGEAYKGLSAPTIASADHCVLCQQELNGEARARLTKFDAYLSDRASSDAENAKAAFEKVALSIRDLKIKESSEAEASLTSYAALSADRKNVVDDIAAYLKSAKARHTAILQTIKTKNYDLLSSLEKLTASPEAAIDSEIEKLEAEAIELEALKRDEKEVTKLRNEYFGLQDRKKLSTEIEVFVERRNKLAELKGVLACKAACSTAAVTSHVTKVRSKLLTPSLAKNLNDEIQVFDLTHLPLKLDDWGDTGSSKVQVALEVSQRIDRNSDVLSEGEQRALGLACFLAELKEMESPHGVIIDDPVSSLDHIRMEAVAKRLVAEAKNGRQVVIFTHNLSFHNMVFSETRLEGVAVHHEWISRRGDEGFGIIDESQKPWLTMSVKDRLKIINAEIDAIKGSYDSNDENQREIIRSIYTKMRETWERLIEEVLFSDVINRFRPEIQTMRLRSARIEDVDYDAVFAGMSRCSTYSGHDKSVGASPTLPKHDAIIGELEFLRTEARRMIERKDDLESKNKKIEKKGVAPEFI